MNEGRWPRLRLLNLRLPKHRSAPSRMRALTRNLEFRAHARNLRPVAASDVIGRSGCPTKRCPRIGPPKCRGVGWQNRPRRDEILEPGSPTISVLRVRLL